MNTHSGDKQPAKKDSKSEISPTTRRPSQALPSRAHREKKSSLRYILSRTVSHPLLVKPIAWTESHLKVLRASFNELPVCDESQPCNVRGSPPTESNMPSSDTDVEQLPLSQSTTAIEAPKVLETLWPVAFPKPSSLQRLHLYYADMVYFDAVEVQALWDFPSNSSAVLSRSAIATTATCPAKFNGVSSLKATPHSTANTPMLCYIEKDWLASKRRKLHLPSEDPDQDPPFVGIFLAMAQHRFYARPKRPRLRKKKMYYPRSRKDFQDVKMKILTHDTQKHEFIVYTGYVTAKFLERFDNPLSAPRGEDGNVAGMQIEFTRVPSWPVLGLGKRLGKALGEDIVGSFDPNYMETWVEDTPASQPIESCIRSVSKNRKRKIPPAKNRLDGDSIADKKRCLREEGNCIGVAVSNLKTFS